VAAACRTSGILAGILAWLEKFAETYSNGVSYEKFLHPRNAANVACKFGGSMPPLDP
jgi:hypothetical protein